nr:serine/threonine-protein phosphatase 7 long form homolog [Ipomoea batatas]
MGMSLHPGPIDPSLLVFQQNHRCRAIWTNRDYDLQLNVGRYDMQTQSREARHPRMLHYLRVAGLYGVAHLTNIKLDHALIAALIER